MSTARSYYFAGEREEGVVCPHCQVELEIGDKTTPCEVCGTVHHWTCFTAMDSCGAYECARTATPSIRGDAAPIRISATDLQTAVPLQTAVARPITYQRFVGVPVDPSQRNRWNKIATLAFVVALIGIPLYGIVVGLVAIALGSIALSGKMAFRRKGLWLAGASILIGIGEFVGHAYFMMGGQMPFGGQLGIQLDEFEPDPQALEDLPPHINRAMKANVLVQTGNGILQQGIGSGVILRIRDGKALIVTNRHVVDHSFDGDSGKSLADLDTTILVKMVDQPSCDAKVKWLAPDGIDLALIETTVVSDKPCSVLWELVPKIAVSDPVFAIGNPHGLAWTHTGGDISQLRRQTRHGITFRIIQISAAINPGNSGGGLYDGSGRLIGINTWTQDKRVAEGLGFAIAFDTLLKNVPADFGLPDTHLGNDNE